MKRYCVILSVLIFTVSFELSVAQSKDELERKRREAEEIIERTNQLLQQTSMTRRTSIEQLNLISRRLQVRQSLLQTIETEIEYIDNSINNSQGRLDILQVELEESRDSYSRLINIAYRHRFAYQKIMFILAAEDFNQAYRRYKYLQQYGQSRQKQIVKIQEITNEIYDEIQQLELQRNEKMSLLMLRQRETEQLSNERRQQNSLISELGKREEELKRELQRQENISKALQNAIEELLREEAKIAAERRIYELTPAEKLISDQFHNNKGGLPWPTERGVVTGFFGEHPHPVLRGIKIQNNGIDIRTMEDAEIRSVFNGVVRQVLTVPGTNNVVILRHGNYLTVYANLAHVYVRAGDNINTGQLIGRVFTDRDDGNKAILHLEIWEENRKLDPSLWLSRQ